MYEVGAKALSHNAVAFNSVWQYVSMGRGSVVDKQPATGWTIRGSNPGKIFRTIQDRPWGLSSLLYHEYLVSFPGRKVVGAWR
jgi:hypothetical protein